MIEPVFSVILPTRGDAPHLRVALRSALVSRACLEVLLIHDRRPGEAALPDELFEDSRVREVPHPSTGVSAAGNTAIGQATGRYVAFVDDDDAWLPGHLEQAKEMFTRYPAAVMVGCEALLLHDDTADGSQPLPTTTAGLRRLSAGREEGPVSLGELLLENMFHRSAVAVDRERLADDERFDPEMAYMEDYDLWLRMARRRLPVFDPRPTAVIRMHRRNISHNWRRMAQGSLEVLARFLEQGLPPGTIEDRRLDRRLGRLWHDLAYACILDEDLEAARRAVRASMERLPLYPKNYAYWIALRMPRVVRRALFNRGHRAQQRRRG